MTDTCNHKVALDMMPKSMSRQKTGKRSEEPSPKQPVPLQMPNSHGIQELDMNVLRGSKRVGIIGLPGMGKSSACRTLLRHLYSSFLVVCVCSGSESENPFYSKFVPRLYIHSGHPATDTFSTIDPFDFFLCVSDCTYKYRKNVQYFICSIVGFREWMQSMPKYKNGLAWSCNPSYATQEHEHQRRHCL